jgi:hypothetical protein
MTLVLMPNLVRIPIKLTIFCAVKGELTLPYWCNMLIVNELTLWARYLFDMILESKEI